MTHAEFAEYFKKRTKQFALNIIKCFQSLPKTEEARIIGKQLLRSASSTAANYRAVCRARSRAKLFSKLSIVVEEADESVFWLEMLLESNITKDTEMIHTKSLLKEANEILAIVASSRKTVREK